MFGTRKIIRKEKNILRKIIFHILDDMENTNEKIQRKMLMTQIDAGVFTTYIENSILIMENSYSRDCETLETPNMFLNPSI